MKWPEVVTALVTALEADAELLATLGGSPRIYPSDDPHAGALPSVAYTLITDTEAENFEDVRLQWDVFGTADEVVTIERRLRALVASRSPGVIGGLAMFAVFLSGRSLPAPEPGTAHRSFDVLYSPFFGA